MRHKFLPLLLAFLMLMSLGWAQDFQGKVVSITDGDTIAVMHDGKAEKIRLNGIDAPESSQAFGTRSKQACSDLCFGQDVAVIVKDTDKYGRTVADIILPDGSNLNREMVKKGMAWWYRQYAPDDKELRLLEYKARTNKLGLWMDETPMPPWQFRHPSNENDVSKAVDSASLPSIPRTSTAPVIPEQTPATNVVAPARQQNVEQTNDTVYVTRTGACYHRAGCRSLRKSMIPMNRADAMKSYRACSICNP